MSGERVLTRRELNRALLARQLLLERRPFSAVKAVERLGGLQAQSTPSPYLSLWTRLEGFEREELTKALTGPPPREGAAAARHAPHRHAGRLLGVLDRAPRARRHPLAARLRGARPESAAGQAGAARPRGARGGRAHVQGDARAAGATCPWCGDADLPLAARVQGYASVVRLPPSSIWGYGGLGVYAAAAGKGEGRSRLLPAMPSTTSSAAT